MNNFVQTNLFALVTKVRGSNEKNLLEKLGILVILAASPEI